MKAILFQVFGGLGLFLFGLHLMSDSLQRVVGDRMKRGLGTITRRPVYGLLLGTIVTGIIQSSSATTVMVCLLYTSPSPRDKRQSRMPSSA